MSVPIPVARRAALALLNMDPPPEISWKAGSFLGTVAITQRPLTEAQIKWLNDILEGVGQPPLAGDAA